MRYTYLGETGLEVSQLCLDCAGFGYSDAWEWNVSERDESLAVIKHAIDRGSRSLTRRTPTRWERAKRSSARRSTAAGTTS